MENQLLLAGDIGGTKTLMALFSVDRGPGQPIIEKSYASGSYADLDSIIDDFLQQTDAAVTHACFGVAGPITSVGDGQSADAGLQHRRR